MSTASKVCLDLNANPRIKARVFACENGLYGDGPHPTYCEGCYLRKMREEHPELFTMHSTSIDNADDDDIDRDLAAKRGWEL